MKHLHHISLSHLFNSMVHHGMAKAIVKRYSYGCFMQKRKQEVFPTLSSCARWIMLAYCVDDPFFRCTHRKKDRQILFVEKEEKFMGFVQSGERRRVEKFFLFQDDRK